MYMKNLIHIKYGVLKADVLDSKLGEKYRVVFTEGDSGFVMKSFDIDEHRFVSLCIYSYNDILFMDHSSYECDHWETHQCTPYELVTFAPELIPYLTDNTELCTSIIDLI